nr:fatty acid desaturase, type 1 [Tanacetum cinerariifolium]
MGAGGQMNVSKTEKDVLKRVPVSKPPFGLADLKKAIPPHCFKRSLIRSFAAFFRDLIIIYSLLYLASYIPLLPKAT